MNDESAQNSAPHRLLGLDAARVLATFGIVWVHVAEGHDQTFTWTSLGRFGTSFYVIVAALFVVQGALKDQPRSFGEELRRRSARLLRPFLIWSLIYGAYYGSRGLNAGASWTALSQWWGPVAGTAVHLWFLPFIFFWGLVASFLTPRLSKLPAVLLLVGGVVCCGGLYWYCYRRLHFQLNRYWLWEYHLHRLDRWIVEVPPFFSAVWGVVVFHRWKRPLGVFLGQHGAWLVAGCGIAFVVTEFAYALQVDAIKEATKTEGRFMANIAAVFLLGAFLALPKSKLLNALAPWGRYTYVAFLVHMLLIEFLRHPVKNLPGYESLWFSLAEAVLIFVASLVVSRTIAKKPVLRFLRA